MSESFWWVDIFGVGLGWNILEGVGEMSWFVLRWMDWFWMGKEGKMEMVYGDEGRVVNRFRFDIAIRMEWKSA